MIKLMFLLDIKNYKWDSSGFDLGSNSNQGGL